MKADRRGGKEVGLLLKARDDNRVPDKLPKIPEIDCSKQKWAHLRTNPHRSFQSMNARGHNLEQDK